MATSSDFNREVHFEIVEPIGVLTTHSTGWSKELNLVKWNGGQPKYDIRDWSPDHAHMSRGVTLHEKEMRHIFELMKQRRQNERRRMQASSSPVQTSSAPAAPPTPPNPPMSPDHVPAKSSENTWPSGESEDDFDDMIVSEDGEVLQASDEMRET